MKKFYFTFDGSSGHPHKQGDYLIVFADNTYEAIRKFKEKYPPVNGDMLASAIFTQEEWRETEKYHPYPPAEIINQPSVKEILMDLADRLVDDCKAYGLDGISLRVKTNGYVSAIAEYKDTDGKQTFTRVSRMNKCKPFIIL